MIKHSFQKVLVIVLLLVVFSVPFYINRTQIGLHDSNAYMVGAVLNTTKSSSPPAPNVLSGSQESAWANTVGNTFIGDQL